MRFSLLLTLLAASLPFSLPSRAGYCEQLYALGSKELGGLRQDFLAKHNNHYSLELPITAVKNQCNLGSCWIYGTVANIETEFAQRTGKKVALSEPYLVLRSLEERVEEALKTPGMQLGEGGRYQAAQSLVEKYGIVPSDVWQPRIPFESNPHSTRLLTFLDHRIAQYHMSVAAGKEPQEQLLEMAKRDLDELLLAYSGPLPKEFTHEGIPFTDPLEFGAYVSPSSGKDVQIFVMRPGDLPESLEKNRLKKGQTRKAWGSEVKAHFRFADAKEMEDTIVAAIKGGKSVAISAEISRAFVDKKTGIMSVEAIPMPKGFAPVPAAYRDSFDLEGGGHQMAIIGVDLDESGRVIKYKIKNSWGEASGDGGIYHMYPDYFRTFVNTIAVH